MAIVFPSEKIARVWSGALDASLKRAPLEQFLHSRRLKIASRGAARDSDNISRATLFIVTGTAAKAAEGIVLSGTQSAYIGQVVCSICDGLAALIGEPRSWRIAALVGTTQLMPPSPGLLNAAGIAANAVRIFAGRSRDRVDDLQQMGAMASEAVGLNSELLLLQLRMSISYSMDEVQRAAELTGAAPAVKRRALA